MRETCHRCGGEIPAMDGGSPFCPHCGAPQLLLSDYSEPLSTGEEDVDGTGASTGKLPPPHPNQIDWKIALGCAVLVAAVAAVLSVLATRIPGVGSVSVVWAVSASLTALALYQRRRPLATMNAGVGAKIGMLVGVVLVFSFAATLSAGLVVARYGLHGMTSFDADAAFAIRTQIDQLAATRPIPAESLGLLTSLQFRTSMMLIGFALVFFGIFLISIFGGAVGGLLRTRRFRTKA